MLNTLRPRQIGRYIADDIFIWILYNENIWFSVRNSLKFVPKGKLVQMMAWCQTGDKPLSESIMVSLQTHICITQPQWVKYPWNIYAMDFYDKYWMVYTTAWPQNGHQAIQIILYALEWRTVSALTRGLFWCLVPELRSNEENKHKNNTRVSTETVRHEIAYIILFLIRHNDDKHDDKNDDLLTSTPCLSSWVCILLMTSQSLLVDVTITRR